MSLNPIEQTVFAYYIAGQANDLVIAPRFYPYGELVLIIEDKISVAIRKFGTKARSSAKTVSKAFIETMIAKGGWSTKQNDFGGAMHQYQADVFKTALRELKAADPIVQEAEGKGPEFWAEKFAALTGA